MCRLDAPRLGIEVVGAVTDILYGAEGDTFVSDGDEATRGIGWQDESFATQVFQSLGVGEVDAWEITLREVCLKDFEFRIKS